MVDDRRILESWEHAERQHVQQIAEEFYEGFNTVADLPEPAVTIFGSARPTRRRATWASGSPKRASS